MNACIIFLTSKYVISLLHTIHSKAIQWCDLHWLVNITYNFHLCCLLLIIDLSFEEAYKSIYILLTGTKIQHGRIAPACSSRNCFHLSQTFGVAHVIRQINMDFSWWITTQYCWDEWSLYITGSHVVILTLLWSVTQQSVLIVFQRFDLYFYTFVQFSRVQLKIIYFYLIPLTLTLLELCALGWVLQPTLLQSTEASTAGWTTYHFRIGASCPGLRVLGPCAKRVIVTLEPSMRSGGH